MQSSRKVCLLNTLSEWTISILVLKVTATGCDRRYCQVRFLQGVAYDISMHIGSGIVRIKDDT